MTDPLRDERPNVAPGQGTSGSPISKTGPAQPEAVDQPEQAKGGAKAEKPAPSSEEE